jgi:hypothetical protein
MSVPRLPRIKNPQDRQAALLRAFRAGATWPEATRAVGVSERTIRRWCEADPDFAAAIEAARDRPLAEVESTTLQQCLDPDPANNTLRMFFLKCRAPEVWNDKVNEPQPLPALPDVPPGVVAAFFAAIRQSQSSATQPDSR